MEKNGELVLETRPALGKRTLEEFTFEVENGRYHDWIFFETKAHTDIPQKTVYLPFQIFMRNKTHELSWNARICSDVELNKGGPLELGWSLTQVSSAKDAASGMALFIERLATDKNELLKSEQIVESTKKGIVRPAHEWPGEAWPLRLCELKVTGTPIKNSKRYQTGNTMFQNS